MVLTGGPSGGITSIRYQFNADSALDINNLRKYIEDELKGQGLDVFCQEHNAAYNLNTCGAKYDRHRGRDNSSYNVAFQAFPSISI